jgi:hypothetical protein
MTLIVASRRFVSVLRSFCASCWLIVTAVRQAWSDRKRKRDTNTTPGVLGSPSTDQEREPGQRQATGLEHDDSSERSSVEHEERNPPACSNGVSHTRSSSAGTNEPAESTA